MTAHSRGGSATAAAVLVVVLLHLVPAATALTILFGPGRFLDAIRGFVQARATTSPAALSGLDPPLPQRS